MYQYTYLGNLANSTKSQKVLTNEEESFSSLLTNSPNPIMVIGPDTSIRYVNPALEELTGFTLSEIIGRKPPYPWWTEETMAKVTREFEEGMQLGAHRVEELFKKKSDERFWVQITSTNVEQNGKFIYHLVNWVDITELKRAEEALRVSEKRYRSLFEDSKDAIYITTREGTFIDVNQSALDLYGYSREEMVGLDVRKVYAHPGDRLRFQQEIEHSGSVKDYPVKFRKKDDTDIYCLLTSTIWRNTDGSMMGYQGIIRDITEQKRIEREIKRSESKYRGLFDSIPDGIMLSDREGRITDANQALLDMLGFTKSEITKLTFMQLTPKKWHEIDAGPARKQILLRGYSDEYEKEYIKKDGTIIPVAIRVWRVRDSKEPPVARRAIIRDITERKQAEEKLIAYQRELRSLASQLYLAEEKQRRQMAMDLHDSIGQALILCKRKLEAILQEPSSPTSMKTLDETYEIIGKTIQEARSLIFELSPPILYELGFEAAAQWLTEQMESRHGIACKFISDGQFKPLDDDISVLLFQAVRELLVNVAKHSQAQSAEVSSKLSGNNICVEVKDNGIGFDLQEARSRSRRAKAFGLFSIRERTRYVGGLLEIKSSPSQGTQVTILAPLKHSKTTKEKRP